MWSVAPILILLATAQPSLCQNSNVVFPGSTRQPISTRGPVSTVRTDHNSIYFNVPEVQQPTTPVMNQTATIGFITDRLVGPTFSKQTFRTIELPSCKSTRDNSPCEIDDEYNSVIREKFDSILRSSTLNNIAQDTVYRTLLTDTVSESVKDEEATIRISPFVEESPACNGQETIIYPQKAKTEKNDWAFVFNHGNFKQGVRVEKCQEIDAKCIIGEGLPSTIDTVCRQKYIYRRMFVLDTEGSNIVSEHVLIPSCCVCYIRKTQVDIGPRIRGHNATTPTSNNPNSAAFGLPVHQNTRLTQQINSRNPSHLIFNQAIQVNSRQRQRSRYIREAVNQN